MRERMERMQMSPEAKAAMEDCRVRLANAKTPEETIRWEVRLRRFQLVEKLTDRKVVSLRLEREKRKR